MSTTAGRGSQDQVQEMVIVCDTGPADLVCGCFKEERECKGVDGPLGIKKS